MRLPENHGYAMGVSKNPFLQSTTLETNFFDTHLVSMTCIWRNTSRGVIDVTLPVRETRQKDAPSIWHRLMKREPVRFGDQSLQKCFMAVLFKIRSVNVFLVFIFTANWVL